MKRQRGSALIFVVVMLVATTTVWLATATLTNESAISQRRREAAYQAKIAVDGAIDQLRVDYLAGSISLPYTVTRAIGPANCTIVVNDNSGGTNTTVNGTAYSFAATPKSLSIVATTTTGFRTFVDTRVISTPLTALPSYYAIMTTGGITATSPIIAGFNGQNGDIASNGAIVLSNASTQINGDIESASTISNSGTLNGNAWPNAPSITFPGIVGFWPNVNYSFTQNQNISTGSLNGIAFPTPSIGYWLAYCGSDLTFKGTVTGKGSLFVKGTLTISGDVTYSDSISNIAVIVQGDLIVSGGVSNMVGYYYIGGNISFKNPGGTTVSRGSLVGSTLSTKGTLNITYDPTVYNTPSEGKNLKIPGFWP